MEIYLSAWTSLLFCRHRCDLTMQLFPPRKNSQKCCSQPQTSEMILSGREPVFLVSDFAARAQNCYCWWDLSHRFLRMSWLSPNKTSRKGKYKTFRMEFAQILLQVIFRKWQVLPMEINGPFIHFGDLEWVEACQLFPFNCAFKAEKGANVMYYGVPELSLKSEPRGLKRRTMVCVTNF